jgi:diaminopropionate ammonia-lyase
VVLVQAGVGGLACSVVSWLSHRYGNDRPYTIVCEPEHAACVLESTRAGHPVALSGPLDTMMASLRCGEVSTLAWPSVAALADAFVAIPDRFAQTAMVKLANPAGSDERVSAGPAGACGLGALLALLGDEPDVSSLRRAAGLGRAARVLMFNTEAEEQ